MSIKEELVEQRLKPCFKPIAEMIESKGIAKYQVAM